MVKNKIQCSGDLNTRIVQYYKCYCILWCAQFVVYNSYWWSRTKVSKNVHVINLHSWICVKSKLRYPSGSRPEFGCQPAFKSCLKHCFSDFFMFFGWKISKIMQNQQRRWKMTKKVFRPAFGCLQYPKAGWNTQHLWQVDLRILVWSFVS